MELNNANKDEPFDSVSIVAKSTIAHCNIVACVQQYIEMLTDTST